VKSAREHSIAWLKPPGPLAEGLRIGLLGGSFNPAHTGHLHVSETALKRLGLDFVWWLVSPQNPLKPSIGMAPLLDRVEEAERIARHPRIRVVDLEHTLGTRYTADTLAGLKRRFPRVTFVWLMGSDSLQDFHRWRRWPEIVAGVPIAVVTRPGTVLAGLRAAPLLRFAGARRTGTVLLRARPPAIVILDGPRNAQSATVIRAQEEGGEAMAASAGACYA